MEDPNLRKLVFTNQEKSKFMKISRLWKVVALHVQNRNNRKLWQASLWVAGFVFDLLACAQSNAN